ncbi:MAG TPA: MFS transporter [Ignavibacteria bacterium]|nr:MFS transporter [Ignavibacteria bacterium]
MKKFLEAYKGLDKTVWIFTVVMFINRVGAMVMPFLSIWLKEEQNLSIAETGLLIGVMGAGIIVGSYLGGFFAKKFGSLKTIKLSLSLMGVFLILVYYSNGIILLAILLFILGCVQEWTRPATLYFFTQSLKPENLPKASALYRLAINIAFAVGTSLGGFLTTISYSALFWVDAVTCWLALTFILIALRNFNDKKVEPKNKITLEGKTNLRLLYFIIVILFYYTVFFIFFNSYPLYLKDFCKINESTIGLLISGNALIIILFEIQIVNYIGKKNLNSVSVALGLLIGALSSLILLSGTSLFTQIIFVTLLTISEMLCLPYLWAIAASLEKESHKNIIAWYSLVGSVAFMISPVITNFVAEKFSYDVAWIMISIFGFISLSFFILLRKSGDIFLKSES